MSVMALSALTTTDKILVADDESDILGLARMILEGEGYCVISASDGEEVVRKVDTEIPDLVLLDVVMPDKSGFEVCKTLKSQSKTRHIPVVMFTALGRAVDRKLGAEAGADGYFTKPFTPESLLAEVKKQIGLARGKKFSKQLEVERRKLKEKKILFEFDPSTPYERLVRDFAIESASHDEAVVVLTKNGSTVRQVLEDEKGVEVIDVTRDLMLSPILEKYGGQPWSLVYDSLTDLALSTDPETAYRFASSMIERLSGTGITAIFLLNPAAHDPKDTYSLRGLFSCQMTYGKQGITNVKFA